MFVSLLLTVLPTSDNFASFLGPPTALADRDLSGLPLNWSPEEGIAWKTDLVGYGQSTPVVHDGTVYVTTVSGANKETCHVAAYALEDGWPLWGHEAPNPSPSPNNTYNSRAASSPAADENGLIAFFGGGYLVALTRDGEVRWERNLVEEMGEVSQRFGIASSVAQNDEHAFIQVQRSNAPYLLAVKKSDGSDVWKVDCPVGTAWSSPMMLPGPNGEPTLVFGGPGEIRGLDPSDGKTLWTLTGIKGNTTPSAYFVGPGQFLVGGSGGRENPDGEATNGLAVVTQEGGKYEAKMVWESEKARSSFGTPAAHAGVAYFVNRSGVLFAHDIETGDPVYTKRIAESIWATPLPAGDRVYFAGKSGATSVIKAGPEFEELAENQLWNAEDAPDTFAGGPVQYAVAAADNKLLLRRGDTLYVVGK